MHSKLFYWWPANIRLSSLSAATVCATLSVFLPCIVSASSPCGDGVHSGWRYSIYTCTSPSGCSDSGWGDPVHELFRCEKECWDAYGERLNLYPPSSRQKYESCHPFPTGDKPKTKVEVRHSNPADHLKAEINTKLKRLAFIDNLMEPQRSDDALAPALAQERKRIRDSIQALQVLLIHYRDTCTADKSQAALDELKKNVAKIQPGSLEKMARDWRFKLGLRDDPTPAPPADLNCDVIPLKQRQQLYDPCYRFIQKHQELGRKLDSMKGQNLSPAEQGELEKCRQILENSWSELATVLERARQGVAGREDFRKLRDQLELCVYK